jgi:hypothetical protein
MGLKSAYRREKVAAEKAAEAIPASEKFEHVEPAADTVIRHESESPPNQAVREAIARADVADDASAHLQAQIQALRQSEDWQRAAAEQMQREQQWFPGEQEFMQMHPELMANPQLTQWAAATAHQQGHTRGTDGFLHAVKANFDEQAGRLAQRSPQYPAASSQSPPAAPPHRPPPPTPPPEPDRTAMYSAPPSRQTTGTGYHDTSPRSVRLSPEEREVARLSGISEREYAMRKLEMLSKQRTGEIQR